jgi:DNA-binding transcriptional LysR family regulator
VQQSLVAVKTGEAELGLYATPAYVARRGPLEFMADAGRHLLIGFDRYTPLVRALTERHALPPREAFAYRTDAPLASIGAIRSGFGAGVCQSGIARREGWVRLLPALSISLPCWVVMHEDLKANPACRATFDALVEGMRAYVRS